MAPPAPPLPFTASGTGRERARREHRPGSRPWLGTIPVLIAAATAWLLLSGLHLGAFGWPGRLAIFAVIFTAVRWLLRRLGHIGRGGRI